MGIFSRLFGEQIPVDDRLSRAAKYVEENGDSGLCKHYHVDAIRENIKRRTGAEVSDAEAIRLVQQARKLRGKELLGMSVFYPRNDEG